MNRRRFINVAAGAGAALAALPVLTQRAEAASGRAPGPAPVGDPAKGVVKGIGPSGPMMLEGAHCSSPGTMDHLGG